MADFAQRVCMRPGPVDAADHAAMAPTPYETLAWTTALAIVRGRRDAAREKYEHSTVLRNTSETSAYLMGRYEAFRDLLQEMEERGKP
jgi:hypothetical protein